MLHDVLQCTLAVVCGSQAHFGLEPCQQWHADAWHWLAALLAALTAECSAAASAQLALAFSAYTQVVVQPDIWIACGGAWEASECSFQCTGSLLTTKAALSLAQLRHNAQHSRITADPYVASGAHTV